MFSTIESAIEYIQNKVRDFYARRIELTNLYQEARSNLQNAHAINQMIPEAEDSFKKMIELLSIHNELELKLKPLANALNVETGLGAFIPAIWTAIQLAGGIAAVIFLAELLYKYYTGLQLEAERVKQIKERLIPIPEQPKPILEQLTGLSGLVVLGIAGFIVFNLVRK